MTGRVGYHSTVKCDERERLWDEYNLAVDGLMRSTDKLCAPITSSVFALEVIKVQDARTICQRRRAMLGRPTSAATPVWSSITGGWPVPAGGNLTGILGQHPCSAT